jgi:transcriptional regulator with XRE-family HTH domain
MDMQAQITIRAKKLGILIRDARLASRRTTRECAAAINVTNGIFIAYEEGRRAPSLPELETLVYYQSTTFGATKRFQMPRLASTI